MILYFRLSVVIVKSQNFSYILKFDIIELAWGTIIVAQYAGASLACMSIEEGEQNVVFGTHIFATSYKCICLDFIVNQSRNVILGVFGFFQY